MPEAGTPADRQSSAPVSRFRRWVFTAVLVVLPLLLLVLAEGTASLLLFGVSLRHREVGDTRSHTVYDSLLGWSSIPGLDAPQYYGTGRPLHVDRAGFREPSVLGAAVPGRKRVVCLGDSFTFGHGVADADTWCTRFSAASAMDPVNMGQVGFGIDQDLLWYRRDGEALEPDLLVLAFVKADFNRTRVRTFSGAPKPWLQLQHGSIVTQGVPVGRLNVLQRAIQKVRPALDNLALWRLALALKGQATAVNEPDRPDSATWALARQIIRTLADRQRAHGHDFVAVLLPAQSDYQGTAAREWSRLLQAAADSGLFRFVDLVPDLKQLPPDSVPPLYIAANTTIPHHPDGHYTARGNDWVAQRVLAHLTDAQTRRGAP